LQSDKRTGLRKFSFTSWSSFDHAALMAMQASLNLVARGKLVGNPEASQS
jgi:hypothetical protein